MDNIYQVERFFQYDYIYFDIALLFVWIFIILLSKEYKSLIIGILISPIIYFIDAYIWWNNKVTNTDVYIREYYINGVKILNDVTQTTLEKFGADFMMTISYALFNFTFLFLAFKYINNLRRVFSFAFIWLSIWLVVPGLSILFDIDNRIVHSVRHMEEQYSIWIWATLIGYIFIYIKSKYNYKLISKLILIGCMAGFIMEFPLYIFGIRPGLNINILIFDTIFMINQAVPILYYIYSLFNDKKKLVL